MGKIATQAEAASIGGATSSGTQCSTKAKAEELGCDVSGTYTNQQLVQRDDLKRSGINWDPYVGTHSYTDAVLLTDRGSSPTSLMTLLRSLPEKSGVEMTPASKSLKEVKDMVDYVGLGNKVIVAYALTSLECNDVIRVIREQGGDAEIIFNYPA